MRFESKLYDFGVQHVSLPDGTTVDGGNPALAEVVYPIIYKMF